MSGKIGELAKYQTLFVFFQENKTKEFKKNFKSMKLI